MEKYKFLEHTADAKFQAFGKTLEDAFSNAAEAMLSIMFESGEIEKKIEKEINVEGKDHKALLYNWLEEILFLLDAELFIFSGVKHIKISEGKLHATILGDTISDKYKHHGEVKAVTYNDMDIIEEKDKIIVQVVVDL